MADKRFEVAISLNVRETKGGSPTPFFDTTISYHDLPEDGLLAIETMLADGLGVLIQDGIARAEIRGDNEMVKRLKQVMAGRKKDKDR